MVYDLCDLSTDMRVATTQLYPLPPIGMHTPFVESLTSYITRLAQAHCVTTHQLLVHTLVGHVHALSLAPTMIAAMYFSHQGSHINGTTQFAQRWINAIEQLTGVVPLEALTMAPWHNILSMRDLLRPQKAWCSVCFHEWRASNQILYEPLLWMLQEIENCPIHQVLLHHTCPQCHKPQSVLIQYSQAGYCYACRTWLGTAPPCSQEAVLRSGSQQWNLEIMTSMVQRSSIITIPWHRDHLPSILQSQVQSLSQGNIVQFAQQTGLSSNVVRRLLAGKTLITLPNLLMLCRRLDTHPLDLLKFNSSHSLSAMYPPSIYTTARNEEQGTVSTQQILIDALNHVPPLSLSAVAEHSGRSRSYLRTHYPDLSKQLRQRYEDSQRRRGSIPEEMLEQELAAILDSDESPFPSLNTVAQRLGYNPQFLRSHFPKICYSISLRYGQDHGMKSTVRQQLEIILRNPEEPPPSFAEVARRLGINRASAHRWYPDLCRAISERYRAFSQQSARQRLITMIDEVRATIDELHTQGEYPSIHRINSHLGKPEYFLNKEVFSAWQIRVKEVE